MAEISKTALRTLTIMEILNDAEKSLSLEELTQLVGANKTSVFRSLKTLEEKGFVAQNSETNKYYITLKLVTMANKIISRLDFRSIAKPHMRDIAKESGLSIHLSIQEGTDSVIIDKVDYKEKIKISFALGRRSPIYCTASGKSLLAFLPPEKTRAILDKIEWKQYTPTTITSQVEMLAELQTIRQAEYSVDREEHNPGIMCVAAPIRNHQGEVKAALSLTGFAEKLNAIGIEALSKLVKEKTHQISLEMGHQD